MTPEKREDEWIEVTPYEYIDMKIEKQKKRREELKRYIIAHVIYHEVHDTTLGEVAEKILAEIEEE